MTRSGGPVNAIAKNGRTAIVQRAGYGNAYKPDCTSVSRSPARVARSATKMSLLHVIAIDYIPVAEDDGATLFSCGRSPNNSALTNVYFAGPTMLREVSSVEHGVTCSMRIASLQAVYQDARTVRAGYVSIDEVGKHFLSAPFGGFKQSGIGREECLSKMAAFTREKNIQIRLHA